MTTSQVKRAEESGPWYRRIPAEQWVRMQTSPLETLIDRLQRSKVSHHYSPISTDLPTEWVDAAMAEARRLLAEATS